MSATLSTRCWGKRCSRAPWRPRTRRSRGWSRSIAPSTPGRSTCARWWWGPSTMVRGAAPPASAMWIGCPTTTCALTPPSWARPRPRRRAATVYEALLREYCNFSQHERCLEDSMIGAAARRGAAAPPPAAASSPQESLLCACVLTCRRRRRRHCMPQRPQGSAGQHPGIRVPSAAVRLPQL